MKSYRQIIGMLLVFALCISSIPAYAMTTVDKENNYSAAVTQLETYLETYGNSSAELVGILSAFNELGGYEQSKFLGYYTSILMKIADEEYDFALTTYLDILEVNTDFNDYLHDALKGSSIGTVDNLKAYSLARECEHRGDYNKAIEYYKQCTSFYDASDRYLRLIGESYQAIFDQAFELLSNGNYVEAYFQFASISPYGDSDKLMASIVNQLGYTPSSVNDILKPVTDLKVKGTHKDSITLSWKASPHAKMYDVYYKQSGNPGWIHAGITENTEITINQLSAKVAYDFRVIAAIGKISAAETVLQNQKIVTIAVGDYVKLGSYPQTSSGTDSTPIEWLVLEIKDNKALLLSRYGLDTKPYNEAYVKITWEKCSLRTWLNDVFLNKAFTTQEQGSIALTNVDNGNIQGYSKWTSGGNNTQDKVFLLSYAEANKYLGVTYNNRSNTKSRVAPTAYAIKQGANVPGSYKTEDGSVAGWWWLRSLGTDQRCASEVSYDGSLNRIIISRYGGSVRPALWINLDAGIF